MAKAEAKAQDAPEQQAVPIVMTLAIDEVFASNGAGTSRVYNWSKDGAAASNAMWSLPYTTFDIAVAWTVTGSGTLPTAGHAYIGAVPYNGSTWGTVLNPKPVWVDNGDGTFTGTITSTGRVGYSVPWTLQFSSSSSAGGSWPQTLLAGATCTLTPVIAAAPPVHTIDQITATGFRVNWSPSGVRDIEANGTIVKTANTGNNAAPLIPGTAYAVRTRADNPESEWTAVVNATTLAVDPAPDLHTIDQITHNSFRVNWTTGGSREIEIDGVSYKTGASTPTVVTGRTPATLYQVRTRHVPYGVPSEWTAAVPVTTSPPPGPAVPTNVVVTDIEMTGFTVSCDAVPGATKYEVRTVEGMV